MATTPLRDQPRGPLKITLLYLAAAVAWILFSDRIASSLVQEPELLNTVQTLKGWGFVAASACLLYAVLHREVTACRTATGHLQQHRQELLDILDAMPVGVALTNGVQVEYININFSERFGYSLDEIPTEAQWFLLAYPDPAYRKEVIADWRAEMARARKSGSPIRPFEVKVTCKNGQVRHVIANTQLINNRIMVIFTDITERELLHNELIKMQKLESIGVLAGGIAHDFNNILTGIMGNLSYARLLLDSAHPARPPLEAAENATRRAAELTQQLLTFAQGGEPVKKVVAVGGLLDETVALMLRGTNVRAEIRIDKTVRLIEADEGQMAQVLNNVVINAVQAMPEGGILRVAADTLRLDGDNTLALPEGDYVRITIADEGCGIPEEIRGRVFDPFFSTKATGSGLGLASAYSIVTRHGGHIGVESASGKGSICTILLPATDKVPPADPAASLRMAAATTAAAEARVILVMDDEAVIRNLAATMLTHLGHQVRTCADGGEAVRLYETALIEGAPYAAVLMDLTVPGGMGGLEAAGRIRALDPDACLIVSSGYSQDPVMAAYQSHGFSGVLAKPYTLSDLEQVLLTVRIARPVEF